MSCIAGRQALRISLRTAPRSPSAAPLRRPYSTSHDTLPSRARHALGTALFLTATAGFIVYYYDSRSAVHKHAIMPLVRKALDAEDGHVLAVRALAGPSWMRPKDKGVDGEGLRAKIWDLEVDNPVGLAAGFDKDAQAIDGLFDLGFGYVEVGSVTPEPQPGNPKPRFFRLEEDSAAINRYGFNSLGHRQALHRLQARIRDLAIRNPLLYPDVDLLHPLPPVDRPRSLRPGHLLGVNLGKNKTSRADSNEDYLAGVRMLGPYADVLVVNVSSPNTPGLRGLQGKDFLARLLGEVVAERNQLPVDARLKPKIAVKVAPDLDEAEIEDIASAIRSSGVDGVIVSNTTVKREGLGLQSAHALETGGLSGAPVKPLALLALSTLRSLLPPSIPIIGCGGISNGRDALDFVEAGASLVQAYTAFGYEGVGFPRAIKDDVARLLAEKRSSWSAEVSQAQKRWTSGVDRLQRELQKEADRLKEVRDAPRLVPLEDVLAEDGIGAQVKPARKEMPASTAVAQSASQPSAPAQALLTEKAAESEAPAAQATVSPRIEAAPAAAIEPVPAAPADSQPTVTDPPRLDTAAWRSVINAQDKRIV